jgi:hypothetical protein
MVSPQFGPWWVLWIHVCSWFVHAPKMFQLCTNQLVVWFVQIRVNKWLVYYSSYSPSRSFDTPLYPRSAMSQGVYPNSLSFRCFHVGLVVESIKELGGASWMSPTLVICSHKCGHMSHFFKFYQITIISLAPNIVWITFSHKFFSQCMTSKVLQINRSCQHDHIM